MKLQFYSRRFVQKRAFRRDSRWPTTTDGPTFHCYYYFFSLIFWLCFSFFFLSVAFILLSSRQHFSLATVEWIFSSSRWAPLHFFSRSDKREFVLKPDVRWISDKTRNRKQNFRSTLNAQVASSELDPVGGAASIAAAAGWGVGRLKIRITTDQEWETASSRWNKRVRSLTIDGDWNRCSSSSSGGSGGGIGVR